MMRFSIKQIKETLLEIAKAIARRAFVASLLLFATAFIIGILIFYYYGIVVQQQSINEARGPQIFNEQRFDDILSTLDKRQQEFQVVDQKDYQDPFRKYFPASSPTPKSKLKR